jgi:transcription-repair coupling factor (superfamily II helicase)
MRTEIDLRAPALLPPDYVPDVHLRLSLYKRVSGAPDAEVLGELRSEVIDRFGALPEPGRVLFELAALKLDASRLGICKVDLGPKGGRVTFSNKPDLDPQALVRLLQEQPRAYRMENPTTLRLTLDLPDVEARIEALRGLMRQLGRVES